MSSCHENLERSCETLSLENKKNWQFCDILLAIWIEKCERGMFVRNDWVWERKKGRKLKLKNIRIPFLFIWSSKRLSWMFPKLWNALVCLSQTSSKFSSICIPNSPANIKSSFSKSLWNELLSNLPKITLRKQKKVQSKLRLNLQTYQGYCSFTSLPNCSHPHFNVPH